jgi:hypothetical protein
MKAVGTQPDLLSVHVCVAYGELRMRLTLDGRVLGRAGGCVGVRSR